MTTEDGTGVVHISPTFGADDFKAAKRADIGAILVQDDEGKMYFGNSLGLLEYDGNSWTFTDDEKLSLVRSLDIDGGIRSGAGYGRCGASRLKT